MGGVRLLPVLLPTSGLLPGRAATLSSMLWTSAAGDLTC